MSDPKRKQNDIPSAEDDEAEIKRSREIHERDLAEAARSSWREAQAKRKPLSAT